MLARLARADAVRRCLCWLVSIYIRLVHATGRWRVERDDIPRLLHEEGRAFILS